ncbi:hypothetical protein ADL25_08875 [Streptomyces sp. NRRL F-5122]|nr:hypothetical protein ADL25_08875 [Streptomyces sp. NRRL F-5122]
MCTAWIAQSIHAVVPVRRGAPENGAGSWSTPANLSPPLTAKPRHNAPWWLASTFTQKTPARAIRGQVVEARPTMNTTSGGSSESEEKDWQAKPAGAVPPSVAGAVITVTPVAKFPRTRRNSPGSTGALSSPATHRNSGLDKASTGPTAVRVPADLR